MKDFFENIKGCEVIEYHEGTTKGKFLYFILSYIPTILMFGLMCMTFLRVYDMLRYENDYTSVLLWYIAAGVLILLMEVMFRILKEKKITEFQECCIIRYTNNVADADMYWINELYDMTVYRTDDTFLAIAKKRGRIV